MGEKRTIMSRLRSFAGILAAAALVGWALGPQAFAADSKAEITELEHKCAAATSADQLMGCYDSTNDLVVYDLMTPREFDGRDAVRADFQNGFSAFKDAKVEFVNL